jgi:hypothetical protein
MKIDMTKKILGMQGEEIKRSKEVLTLKEVAMNALLMPVETDKEDKKYEKWELYKKIKDAKQPMELTTKEAAFIKELIGKHETVLIMGQCWDLIEGK